MSEDPHNINLYDYALPDELIAAQPAEERSGSRLLVLQRRGGLRTHTHFGDIGHRLRAGDLLVLNNARVVPARLYGFKETGGKVEVFLVRQDAAGAPPWPQPGEETSDTWIVLLSPSARLRPGQTLRFPGSELACELLERRTDGSWRVRFGGVSDLPEELQRLGTAPLPPYILRARKERGLPEAEPADRSNYQTVYASVPGAVAAPTAGLHFTPELLDALRAQGVRTAEITLLVGPGTFKPVKQQDLTRHVLDPEFYVFPEQSRQAVQQARVEGRRVIAVGTTSCRVLEYVAKNDLWDRETGWTDLYVYPPYEFQVIDALLTNFHLPRSTLLMLVAAFAGRELVLETYREAIRERYRFYSYGDAMLIV